MRHFLGSIASAFARMLVLFTLGLGILIALIIALVIIDVILLVFFHSGWRPQLSLV
jgi:maltodextrin utilization protein YvdJ